MKVVGFIPCKLDSGRLMHKNLKKINGVNLLDITVQYMLTSYIIDEIYISTDEPDIVKANLFSGVWDACRDVELLPSSRIHILKRPGGLAGECFLVDVYMDFANKYQFDYMVASCADSLPKPISLDMYIEKMLQSGIHELFTVNSSTMRKNSSLNIISREAAVRGMVAGYTEVLPVPVQDIHYQHDLDKIEKDLKIYGRPYKKEY